MTISTRRAHSPNEAGPPATAADLLSAADSWPIGGMFSQFDSQTRKRLAAAISCISIVGIGLSLVRGIVTLHGGTVEAESRGPDQGSLFVVRLQKRLPSAGADVLPT